MSDHQDRPAVDDAGPVTLRWAVLVLWIEATALGALTLVEVYALATGGAEPRRSAVAAVTAATAVLAVQLGRWLVRRRAWARGPAIVLQLSALPVAFFMVAGPGGIITRIGGVLVGIVAVTCAGLLLAPSSRLGLTIR